MTRKDFLLLSSAINATRARILNATMDETTRAQQLRGVRRTAAHIADAIFEEQGSRFDVVRFLNDCGFRTQDVGAIMHQHLEEKMNAEAR